MTRIKMKKDKLAIRIKKNNVIEHSSSRKYMYYPDFSDKDFYEKIYIKKEFFKNKIKRNNQKTEDICNARLFNLSPQQEFLKNYISTVYRNVLKQLPHKFWLPAFLSLEYSLKEIKPPKE